MTLSFGENGEFRTEGWGGERRGDFSQIIIEEATFFILEQDNIPFKLLDIC